MRNRALALATVVALAGALAADVLRPAEPAAPAGVRVRSSGGVVSCPYALAERGRGYLHLANLGDEPAAARVTIVPQKGKRQVLTRTLAPGATGILAVHKRAKGSAGAVVEYAGGEVVVSHALWLRRERPGDRTGGGAAGCRRASSQTIVVPHLRTYFGETRLALLNPGSSDANVSVTLFADGKVLAPERLQRRVVVARGRREFRLGDFAFDARDLTAVVHADAGRVVAEGLVRSPEGVQLLAGTDAAPAIVAVSGGGGSGSAVSFVSVGEEEDTGFNARLMTPTEQGKAPRIPSSLPPAGSVKVGIPEGARADLPAAYVGEVTFGSPLAGGTTWEVRRSVGRDRAAAEATAPARRWGGVIGALADRFTARVVLANPGTEPARVRLRVLGGGGPAQRELTIDPGRVVYETIARGAGTVAVDVVASHPIAVVLAAAATGGPVDAFGLTATPLDPGPAVDVKLDVRLGVPARLPER